MTSIPMNKFFRNDQSKQKVYTLAGKWALVLGALYLTSLYSYLLFHTFAEIFSTAVALAIFLLLWNVRRSMDNSYLLLVGVAYLFVGALDLLHTLAYKGMGVFGAYEEDLPTQLWIGVRYMQSISLLIAPFFLDKRMNLKFVVAAYTLASALLLGAIFYWEVFPVCFVPGKGLTPFKVLSEYIISVTLLAAIALLARKRDRFDPPVFRFLVLSIAFTIVSELSFTLYVDAYGFFSLIGHFLKIIAFYCIYKAIVEQGVAKPLEVLFRNLKLSERALRGERDFTSAVLSTAGAMVVVLDREGRIMRFNRACEQLTGRSFEEVEGSIFWNLFVPPEEVKQVKAVFERLKMGDFPNEHENHWVAKDGTRRLIHWSNTGMPDSEGAIQFIIGTGIDITEGRAAQDALKMAHDHLETQVQVRTAELVKTCDQLSRHIRERKRAEEYLALERNKLRSILDNMADGVYIADAQYRIEYANPALEKEFGPVDGRKCHEYLEGKQAPCPGCKHDEVFAGKSLQWEWRSKVTGKTYEISDTPIQKVDGSVRRLEILHDVTSRKAAEEALRDSEEKYRIVASNTYAWEWWIGHDGEFIYISPSCKEVTLHEGKEFEADPELLLKIVHPEDVSSFKRHLVEIEEKRLDGEVEFRILRPDGSVRWLAHTCKAVFDDKGVFLGHRGSNLDITERVKAQEAVRGERKLFHDVLENLPAYVVLLTPDYHVRFANGYFRERFGESQGLRCFEFLFGRSEPCEVCETYTSLKTMAPHEWEWTGPDGRIYSVFDFPFTDTDGTTLILELGIDITDRKKAEGSVLNALAEIRVLKERLEAENIYLRQEMKLESRFSHIIGESNAIKYVLYRAEHVAPTSTTVLVLGETGTGKDLIASAIHQRSPRKDKPLIALNCAALPANLIESELFGREKGAFTGADTRQIGRFELADGSTLFLDEIGELPPELQAKLLRVIQHGEFERLGSSRAVKVDVRIVATTNRNLEEEVRNGRFRQDLYYRLNVFPITIPPLRQRKEDIPLLVEAFLEKYARDHGKEFTSIQSEVMKVLQEYDWPGNIRELQNVIERAVIMCHGPVLQLADKLNNASPAGSSSLRTLEETEREQILKTLSETGWRINGKNGAAAILGLNPSTLRARMHKLGIHRPEVKT
jgi:formate hydrogenlyase transcriptional activator